MVKVEIQDDVEDLAYVHICVTLLSYLVIWLTFSQFWKWEQ